MQRQTPVPKAVVQRQARVILNEHLIGVDTRKPKAEESQTRRAAQMSILYHDHLWSLSKVGAAFNMSRERVRQIFKEFGLPTRAPVGSAIYNQSPDLTNLRRVKRDPDQIPRHTGPPPHVNADASVTPVIGSESVLSSPFIKRISRPSRLES